MQLMTKEIEKKLNKVGLYGQDSKGDQAEVIVKYFNPVGNGIWLVTGGEKLANGDWLLYGCHNIYEWEWGEVLLSELQNVRLPFGLKIEKDLYSKGTVEKLRA